MICGEAELPCQPAAFTSIYMLHLQAKYKAKSLQENGKLKINGK